LGKRGLETAEPTGPGGQNQQQDFSEFHLLAIKPLAETYSSAFCIYRFDS
jgi:hypothetical protein